MLLLYIRQRTPFLSKFAADVGDCNCLAFCFHFRKLLFVDGRGQYFFVPFVDFILIDSPLPFITVPFSPFKSQVPAAGGTSQTKPSSQQPAGVPSVLKQQCSPSKHP
jgi:hypothetical protein